MEQGRSYVILRDCSILPWEEYTSSTRLPLGTILQTGPSTTGACLKAPMNLIVPRKTSEHIKKQMSRPLGMNGRTNTADSMNIRDFLEPTSGSMISRRRQKSDAEILAHATSYNIRRWK
jgi:hypothetical protein